MNYEHGNWNIFESYWEIIVSVDWPFLYLPKSNSFQSSRYSQWLMLEVILKLHFECLWQFRTQLQPAADLLDVTISPAFNWITEWLITEWLRDVSDRDLRAYNSTHTWTAQLKSWHEKDNCNEKDRRGLNLSLTQLTRKKSIISLSIVQGGNSMKRHRRLKFVRPSGETP